MEQRPLVEGYIDFGLSLNIFQFLSFGLFFPFSPLFFWFLSILGPPYWGIGATIRIGREIRCLLHAGFLFTNSELQCFVWLKYSLTKYALKVPKIKFLGLCMCCFSCDCGQTVHKD